MLKTSYVTVTNVATSTCPPATTVTVYAGPSGSELVPSSLFEDDAPSWIRVGPEAGYTIVNSSADGSFSGLFGPCMLRFSSNPDSSIGDCKMLVPATEKPHPDGRDWAITAFFRTDGRDLSRCYPDLGWWSPAAGRGERHFPDFKSRAWQMVTLDISDSAAGVPGGIEITLAGPCWGQEGFVYVDGVYIS